MRLPLRPQILNLRNLQSQRNVFSNPSKRLFSALTTHSIQVHSINSATSSQDHGNQPGLSKLLKESTRKTRNPLRPSQPKARLNSAARKDGKEERGDGFQQRVQARRHAKLELRYLVRDDKIHVRLKDLLETDAKKAEAMVKLLSREPNRAVAAWNILIDDALRNNPPKFNLAFKLYNQMKKSHQEPDEITMRTILNGIANNPPVAPNVPEKCKTLYNYWSSGRTDGLRKNPPTTKDFNKLLSIAVQGKKWEMMWQLLTDAPDTGPQAPDSATYGVVLEGIEGQMLEAEKNMREEHIVSALRVWKSMLNGCRPGKLELDSVLVTKMGNLLVKSTDPRCLDAVFDLIKLATGIPRYDESEANGSQSSSTTSTVIQNQAESDSGSFESLLASSFRNPGSLRPKSTFKPSIYILNFVLDACTALHRKSAAMYYYSSFQAAGVLPDRVNLNGLLRVLRETRSAKEAVSAVESYVGILDSKPRNSNVQKPSWGTFRIAMSACGRQRKDGGLTIRYATQLYKIRQRVYPDDVDTQVVENYLICIDLATSQTERTEALKLVAMDLSKLIKSSEKETKNGPDPELIKRVIGQIDRRENTGDVSRDVFERLKPVMSNYVFLKEKAHKKPTRKEEEH